MIKVGKVYSRTRTYSYNSIANNLVNNRFLSIPFFTLIQGIINNIGLHDEPYFKYFNYSDFLTINNGLSQIRKYSEINNKSDLINHFSKINLLTKKVKEEIYTILIADFKYFS